MEVFNTGASTTQTVILSAGLLIVIAIMVYVVKDIYHMWREVND